MDSTAQINEAAPDSPHTQAHSSVLAKGLTYFDWFVPPQQTSADPDRLQRARFLVASAFGMTCFAVFFWVQLYLAQGYLSPTALLFMVDCVLLGSNPFVLRLTRSQGLTASLFVTELLLHFALMSYATGGPQSAALVWTPAIPLLATFLVGPVLGLASAGLIVAELTVFYFAEQAGFAFPQAISPDQMDWFHILGIGTLAIFIALLGWLYEVSRTETLKIVERALVDRKNGEQHLQTLLAEHKHTEDALSKAKDAAETANRAKSEFLANMSHELRTPLHGILSFANFGINKSDKAKPEKLKGYFQQIERSGKTLLALLNDLLDLAKLEAGKMPFTFHAVDLNVLLGTVADEFTSLSADRKLTVACDIPQERTEIVLDSVKIMQVVRNLLGNAVKFSPDGGTIGLRLSQTADAVTVSICDQGMGIPEEELESIFDKFIQSSKTKTGAGGTGLGLSICREIVAAHKGNIWAKNRAEGGAQFSIQIPTDLEETAEEAESNTGEQGKSGRRVVHRVMARTAQKEPVDAAA